MDHYLQVFIESAWEASIIPMASDATFAAMLAFGTFSMLPAWALAVVGATLGQAFNWGLGLVLFRIKYKKGTPGAKFTRAKELFHKYWIYVLLLCWLPMFNLFTVAAGAFSVRFRTVLILTAVGEAVHYGKYLV